jgi:hypothetical protein
MPGATKKFSAASTPFVPAFMRSNTPETSDQSGGSATQPALKAPKLSLQKRLENLAHTPPTTDDEYCTLIVEAARHNYMGIVIKLSAEYICHYKITNPIANPFYTLDDRMDYPYRELFGSILELMTSNIEMIITAHGRSSSDISPCKYFNNSTYKEVWEALITIAEFPYIKNPKANAYSFTQITLHTIIPVYIEMHGLIKAKQTMPRLYRPVAVAPVTPSRSRAATASSEGSTVSSDTIPATPDTITADLARLTLKRTSNPEENSDQRPQRTAATFRSAIWAVPNPSPALFGNIGVTTNAL